MINLIESLDLRKHSKNEIEYKEITYNNCSYLIGPHLNTGGEKIVHSLMNGRSNLYEFVLKIWRRSDQAKLNDFRNRWLAAKALYDGNIEVNVPNVIIISGFGGVVELQENIETENNPIDRDPTTASMQPLADMDLSNSNFDRAKKVYNLILSLNPYHSQALNNLAHAYYKSKEMDSALQCISKAVAIEPNYFPYQRSYIIITSCIKQYELALAQFEKTRSQFPYIHSLDDIAIDLYRTVGQQQDSERIHQENLQYNMFKSNARESLPSLPDEEEYVYLNQPQEDDMKET